MASKSIISLECGKVGNSLFNRLMLVILSTLFLSCVASAQKSNGSDPSPSNERSAEQDPGSRGGPDGGRGGRGGRGGDGFRGPRDGDGPREGRGGRGRGRDRGNGPGGEADRGRGEGPEGRRGGDRATRGLGIMGTPEGLFTPDYMTRNIPMVVTELELADDQRSVIEELFNVYDVSFREALEALRSGTEDARESYEPDPEIDEGIQQVRTQMREMRQEMREAREAIGRDRREGVSGQDSSGRSNDQNQDAMGEEAEQISQEQRREQAEAMRAEFRKRFEVLRDDMRSIQEARIKSDQMQAMLDVRMLLIRDFASTKKSLRESVESGIRALLLENQVDNWEAIERTLRRKRLLSRGRLSGESTDLVEMLDRIELSEEVDAVELQTLMSTYEIDLDQALRQREGFDYADGLDLMDQLRKWEFDTALRTIRKGLSMQESIRDLNDQYIEAISLVLPALERQEFRTQSLMEGYSRIFRPTRVERMLVNAMEIEDLDPDVLMAVAELMQGHAEEIAVSNEDLLIIYRQEDLNRILERSMGRINRMQGIEPEEESFDPVQDAMDGRDGIDERYRVSLESLLTPEQFESIAGRRGRDGQQEGRRGGRDREGFSREEFMKRFDRNGDGELDDEERETMREQFRQRRDGAGRGGRQQGPPPGEV